MQQIIANLSYTQLQVNPVFGTDLNIRFPFSVSCAHQLKQILFENRNAAPNDKRVL